MRTLTYQKLVRSLPLLLDLQAANVPVFAVRPDPSGAASVVVEVDDGADDATVAAVVAAQDVAALDAQAAQAKADDDSDRARVKAAYQDLVADAAALANDAATMPATLTAAQIRARLIQIESALAQTNTTLAALARYLGRRL